MTKTTINNVRIVSFQNTLLAKYELNKRLDRY